MKKPREPNKYKGKQRRETHARRKNGVRLRHLRRHPKDTLREPDGATV